MTTFKIELKDGKAIGRIKTKCPRCKKTLHFEMTFDLEDLDQSRRD